MWTRAEIKNTAKAYLKENFWTAFLVCLIFTIIMSIFNVPSNQNNRDVNQYRGQYEYFSEFEDDYLPFNSNPNIRRAFRGGFNNFLRTTPFYTFSFISLGILGIIVQAFIVPLLKVGLNYFFIKGYEGDTSFQNLFKIFGIEIKCKS